MEYKTKYKKFGDLVPGDYVIGSDGAPVEVTNVYEKHFPERMFELVMEDGEVIQASGNHLWYCESEQDVAEKDSYLEQAREYFLNNEIPEKLVNDEHFPINLLVKLFDNSVNTSLFIARAAESLGHSSVTPHVIMDNQLSMGEKEEIYNYSYNDFIDFLHKMKKAVLAEKGYFYFGKVRSTIDIFELMLYNISVNIPHKGDIL